MAHRSVGELMVWAVFLGLGFYCLSDLKAWFFDTRSVRAKISRSNGPPSLWSTIGSERGRDDRHRTLPTGFFSTGFSY